MLNIKVIRYSNSLNYRRDPAKPLDWLNNDAHNCEDDFIVYWGTEEVLRVKAQTVSNMEGLDAPTHDNPRIKFTDTIAPGPFQLRAFVDQRSFYGRINGICDTKTLSGDYIGMASITKTNTARWLNHDDQKHRTDAQGKPVPAHTYTRVCWSAGCLVLHEEGLTKVAEIFDKYSVKAGDLIPGVLELQTSV